MIAAALQLTTTPESVHANLNTLRSLINDATTKHNANLVVLPEYNRSLAETVKHPSTTTSTTTTADTPLQDALSDIAKEFKVFLVAGSIPTIQEPDATKFQNTLFVFNPDGERIATYHKIHLFKFEGPPAFDEGETVVAGATDQSLTVALTDEWKARLSICYDVRFPELYRQQGDQNSNNRPYNIIVCPAAFTVETGKAHWEVLLRARAIENQAYVIASAQVGVHPVTGRTTYGHSLIIDPWGTV
ncbi:carbon-nitrogen hydrolase, partial [Rhizoclosmatium globosum]